jgi:outer membrane receptor protein involved in Fe transport
VYVDTRFTRRSTPDPTCFPEKEQQSFALFNARIGVRGPQAAWALEFWGQNIFNKDYQQVAFNTPVPGRQQRRADAGVRGGRQPDWCRATWPSRAPMA